MKEYKESHNGAKNIIKDLDNRISQTLKTEKLIRNSLKK
jgi:hypothetical protein